MVRLIVGSELVTLRSKLTLITLCNVGFLKLRRRDHGNFGSEELSGSEISSAFVKHISYYLIIFFFPLLMFLFCLAFQTVSIAKLYSNPDKQERKTEK